MKQKVMTLCHASSPEMRCGRTTSLEMKMKSVIWRHSILPAKKFQTTVGVEKVMVTNFWGIHGTIRINCMLCGMTINCSYLRNEVRMLYGSNLMSGAWPAYPTCAARLYTVP